MKTDNKQKRKKNDEPLNALDKQINKNKKWQKSYQQL